MFATTDAHEPDGKLMGANEGLAARATRRPSKLALCTKPPATVAQFRSFNAVGVHPAIARRVALQDGPLLRVPFKQRHTLLMAPQSTLPRHAGSVDTQSKICLAEHTDGVDAQPPREGVQMVGRGLNAPCQMIDQTLNDQTRNVSAILLLHHTALEAVVVQRVHATPRALLVLKRTSICGDLPLVCLMPPAPRRRLRSAPSPR